MNKKTLLLLLLGLIIGVVLTIAWAFLSVNDEQTANTPKLISKDTQTPITYASTYPINVAHCQVGSEKFDIELRSLNDPKTADELDVADEMTIWLEKGKFKARAYLNDTKHGSEQGTASIAFSQVAKGSACDKTTALVPKDGILMVVLSSDDRPFGRQVTSALFDLNTVKELGRYNRIAPEARKDFALEIIPEGITFLSSVNYTDGQACSDADSCNNLTVMGTKVKEYHDYALPSWVTQKLVGPDLKQEIDAERTWNTTSLKPYFADRAAFEKAFEYGYLSKIYNVPAYFLATLTDGRTCVTPTAERQSPDEKTVWICI